MSAQCADCPVKTIGKPLRHRITAGIRGVYKQIIAESTNRIQIRA